MLTLTLMLMLMLDNGLIIVTTFCFSSTCSGLFGQVTRFVKAMTGPKYDGNYLHNLLKEGFKVTKLHQTLTNLVIPAFDIKLLQPVIFSSFKVGLCLLKILLLSPLCFK